LVLCPKQNLHCYISSKIGEVLNASPIFELTYLHRNQGKYPF
jgi:hypothetical protein